MTNNVAIIEAKHDAWFAVQPGTDDLDSIGLSTHERVGKKASFTHTELTVDQALALANALTQAVRETLEVNDN